MPAWSYWFQLDLARVVYILPDELTRLWRHAHQGHAIRRVKPMPRSLRNDGYHPSAERDGLRRLVAMREIERCSAVEDVHQFVGLGMAFPAGVAGEFRGEDRAVAVGRYPRPAALAVRAIRLRRAAAKNPELCQLSIEINDGDHGRSSIPQ